MSRHNLFSPRKSARETLAFAGGLAAIFGSFAPWYTATRTTTPPMGETTVERVVLGSSDLGWATAVFAALAMALALTPLPKLARTWARAGLFALALLAAGLSALGPGGPVFGWDPIFQSYTDVRPAWGLVLVVVGSVVGLGAVLSRARDPAAMQDGATGAR